MTGMTALKIVPLRRRPLRERRRTPLEYDQASSETPLVTVPELGAAYPTSPFPSSDCTAGGGAYQGDDVTCIDADCPDFERQVAFRVTTLEGDYTGVGSRSAWDSCGH